MPQVCSYCFSFEANFGFSGFEGSGVEPVDPEISFALNGIILFLNNALLLLQVPSKVFPLLQGKINESGKI